MVENRNRKRVEDACLARFQCDVSIYPTCSIASTIHTVLSTTFCTHLVQISALCHDFLIITAITQSQLQFGVSDHKQVHPEIKSHPNRMGSFGIDLQLVTQQLVHWCQNSFTYKF